MTTQNLESKEELVEQKEPNQEETSEKEPDVSTAKPPEVSGDETPTFDETQQGYIDKQIEEAKEKALREGQSSKDRELQPLKDKIAELSKKAREAEHGALEKSLLEKYGDTPETKDLAAAWAKVEDAKDELAQREKTVEDYEQKVASQAKEIMASKLSKQYEGADEKELLKAESPEQMQTMARDAHIAFLKGNIKPPAKKIDSSVPGAKGVSVSNMSPDEKLKEGFRKLNKK